MNPRLLILTTLVASWFLAIGVRIYDLQVRSHDHYFQKAEQQQQRVVVLDPPRGTIYDSRGRELAVSVEVKSVAADPTSIEDPQATAEAVAAVLGVDPAPLAETFATRRQFVWVKRKLDLPVAEEIEALKLKGIFTLPENKRYYPLRQLGAQILGYVGTDNSGLAGLEYLYEKEVAGEQGRRTVVRDARLGTVYFPHTEVSNARPGRDLYLTIDATIQHIVEKELEKAVKTSASKTGMAVVMDPNTGAILALASYPTFDPNNFAATPPETWRNRPIMDAYEPGSTFKMVTLAAALEADAIDPLRRVDCGMGSIVLGGVRINDHTPFGKLTTQEIIANSSNIGAIKLGMAAGRKRFYDTIVSFGFGRPTDIDLPSESSGILRPVERWTPLAPAYISFGQGISVTALQLTNSFAAIANGGELLRPFVVASIGTGTEERRVWRQRQVVGRPVSRHTVDQIRAMLESVVVDGTATKAGLGDYRAAGKTGTAEKAIPGRGYAANRYIASFTGFAPVSRPVLAASVILDEPWPRYHGGDVAAPAFAAIAQRVLLYLGVPPERRLGSENSEIELAADWGPVPEAPEVTEDVPLALAWRGDLAGADVPAGTVPDLMGLSARQALVRTRAMGVRLALNGHGAISRQLPEPGTPLETAGGAVEVWLTAGGP